MRIISGLFKGKKIFEPNDIKTRPLKDLTKESIFNILSHSKKFEINLNKAIVLDLFSGVGSFGIECLSRGVEKVIFVENYEGVLPVLKKNLDNLKFKVNFEIIEKDIYKIETISDPTGRLTLTGSLLSVLLPSPRLPWALRPQHAAEPSSRIAHVCC